MGFMLAGLRDRRVCHCGNVEPPRSSLTPAAQCSNPCKPGPWSSDSDGCGASLYTMVYSTSYTNYAYWQCKVEDQSTDCVFPFTVRGGWDVEGVAPSPGRAWGPDVTHVRCAAREDTLSRWCATEVDAEGVMVEVSPCTVYHAPQGAWAWCSSSCYSEMLMNGTEYCGNHTACSNNNDDSRGLACSCEAGYTAHRINYGGYIGQYYCQ